MMQVLWRKIRAILSVQAGIKLAFVMVIITWFALISMPYAEGWSYWTTLYWLSTTVTTVGYGDFSPQTVYGQVCAILIMFSGIGAAAALITSIISGLVERKGKAMKGLGDYSDWEGHTVIVGWNEKIPRLIEEMKADQHFDSDQLILCSAQDIENPLPDVVKFVKGDTSSDDVLHRSGCRTAKNVIIYGRDDHETILTALGITHCDDDDPAHIVAYVREEENAKHLKRINRNIKVVRSGAVHLLVQETQDPGIGEVIECLLSNKQEQTLYHVQLGHILYSFARSELLRKYPNAIVIGGVDRNIPIINPKQTEGLTVTGLLVIASERPSGLH
jgi:voltage-gated potassium channel